MPQEPQHQRAAMRHAACLAWQVMRGFVAESGVQYVIVPATDKPGQTGPFSLGVYAEHEVKFRKIADSHEARAATTCSVQAPSFIIRQQAREPAPQDRRLAHATACSNRHQLAALAPTG
jgi:hypothetical protein